MPTTEIPVGPLFQPPGAGGPSWLEVLPLLLTVPAAILLVWGLIHGRLPVAMSGAAAVLPVAAYALGGLFLLEESRDVEFCGSCHVMAPLRASLSEDDGLLASTHFRRGRVPHDQACYTCHSGYGIWGGLDAKIAGFEHMINTVTGEYDLPIRLRGPFDIDSCLDCHAQARAFRDVEAHQDPDLQKQLLDREMGCTGICHPAAHPESALEGGTPRSAAREMGVPAS